VTGPFDRLRRDPVAVTAFCVLLVMAATAIFAPRLAPFDPTRQLDIVALKDQPPSWQHPFGTDPFSRDVLSRVLFGGRVSLSIAALAVVAATTIGVAWGTVAGSSPGRWIDDVLMRVVDVGLGVPRILVLIALTAIWGHISVLTLVLVIGLTGWFMLSRFVRADVVALRQRDFFAASRALGATPSHLIARHILPAIASTVAIWAALDVANVILLEAGLSFLGLGVQPPIASWGNIMQDGADRPAALWWLSVFPGLAIVLAVGASIILSNRLRDALDPRELPRA
jgi:peptide/nickel transport system permease protein